MKSGDTISHYRIVGQLGAGGMGVVYSAEDVRLERPVALKFLAEDLAHSHQAIERLRSEARAASALNHPNICTIHDIGEERGHPFIVMELMKGQSLRDRLAGKPMKVQQLVDMGIQIADALDAAHSAGIIHRDIKPGNIFLTERGQVKSLDFGLAKLAPHFADSRNTTRTPDPTAAGITLGTIAYMSPEQATGEELDGRTDLFSLGVVLYECATGRQPFTGKTSAVTLSAILNSSPIAPIALNPELPARLEEVINNCLEKDREMRYQSAADLRADLKRVRRDIESGHSRPVEALSASGSRSGSSVRTASGRSGIAETSGQPTRRTPVLIAAAVVLAAVIAGAWYAVTQRRPSATDDGRAAILSDAAVQSRLTLAESTLDAKNYRAALAYANEVLAIDPRQPKAEKIRDESRQMLDRFDRAIAATRERLAAGDVQGASRALETARAIDPTSPAVGDLNYRVSELRASNQAEAGRRNRPDGAAAARERPQPPPPVQQQRRSAPVPPASPVTGTPTDTIPAATEPQPSAPSPPATQPASSSASRGSAQPETPPAPKPDPPPAPPEPKVERKADPAPAPAEDDDASIRRLVTTYGRAIESKDLALFRVIKPNLSSQEERRLRDAFRDISSQRVTLSVLSISRHGDEASVAVRRRDTIQAAGRQQTAESHQTLRVAKTNGNWIITDIR